MNGYRKFFLAAAVLFLAPVLSRADEGMWMIQQINAALEKKMQERGLLLSARDIYDADAPGASVSDAVISLGFYCSGSIISSEGLLITNHHCAYADVHGISTPEHNYLEDGFWALTREEERPIKGVSVSFLKKVIDVTDEVEQMTADYAARGEILGSRRLSFQMEKRYSEQTGLEASLASMWSGEKYYMALYQEYDDVRLVAAPPVSIAAFGGDIDNWEWPQHKCDFAMYRIYADPDGKPAGYSEKNVPLKTEKKLEISLDGYGKGDFAMVIGYPGRTDRYCPSAKIRYDQAVDLPICNRLRKDQMAIITAGMNADPQVRLKYSDRFFSLSNVQENDEGKEMCFKRFDVADRMAGDEKELAGWIKASPERRARWGGVLDSLDLVYGAMEVNEKDRIYYRETMVRGTNIGVQYLRLAAARNEAAFKAVLERTLKELDLGLEKKLMRYCLEEYCENIPSERRGPYQNEVVAKFSCRGGKTDYGAMTEYLWNSSVFASEDKVRELIASPSPALDTTLARFIRDRSITDFNDAEGTDLRRSATALEREFTQARYEMEIAGGKEIYPDANSTMRLTYGVVDDLSPYDGVLCSWRTTTAGILEKYDPSSYDFSLRDDWKALLEEADWGRWGTVENGRKVMYVDFITDNDITGGNSGSPVLDARGRLIGLAFDGNKESLASDNWYTPYYNKCVCTDIRFVLWTLDRYAGMGRIIEELGL